MKRYAIRHRILYYEGTIGADERWKILDIWDPESEEVIDSWDSRQEADDARPDTQRLPHGAYSHQDEVVVVGSRDYTRAEA